MGEISEIIHDEIEQDEQQRQEQLELEIQERDEPHYKTDLNHLKDYAEFSGYRALTSYEMKEVGRIVPDCLDVKELKRSVGVVESKEEEYGVDKDPAYIMNKLMKEVYDEYMDVLNARDILHALKRITHSKKNLSEHPKEIETLSELTDHLDQILYPRETRENTNDTVETKIKHVKEKLSEPELKGRCFATKKDYEEKTPKKLSDAEIAEYIALLERKGRAEKE